MDTRTAPIASRRGPRVTLVSMSGLRVVDPMLRQAGLRLPGLARRASALSQLPPLGLLTIAATLRNDAHVELITDGGDTPEDVTVTRILKTRPDVVAFSSLTPAVDRAARLGEQLRDAGVRTVIGGLHATADPDWCQSRFDAVGVGDGEAIFASMIDEVANGQSRSIYRASPITDLADSPMPRWDLWTQSDTPRFTVQTMRGCPWACSFCAASRLLGPARNKPLHRISAELDQIATLQRRPWIELADDNTFAGNRDADAMLDALRDIGARWFTESDWLIGERPDLIRRMAASGCRQVLIGFESPVHLFGGMGGKTASWDRMMAAAERIQAAGVVVNACFIVGVDGETRASIDRLGDFLNSAPFGEIQVTLQTPFPGTKLRQTLMDHDRMLPGDYSRHTLFDVTYRPDRMSADDLQSAFRGLVTRVYANDQQSRRNAIVRSIRKIRGSHS